MTKKRRRTSSNNNSKRSASAAAAMTNPETSTSTAATTRTKRKKTKNDDHDDHDVTGNNNDSTTTTTTTSRRSSSSSSPCWVCSTCTFHNPMSKRRCEMCSGRKSVSAQVVVKQSVEGGDSSSNDNNDNDKIVLAALDKDNNGDTDDPTKKTHHHQATTVENNGGDDSHNQDQKRKRASPPPIPTARRAAAAAAEAEEGLSASADGHDSDIDEDPSSTNNDDTTTTKTKKKSLQSSSSSSRPPDQHRHLQQQQQQQQEQEKQQQEQEKQRMNAVVATTSSTLSVSQSEAASETKSPPTASSASALPPSSSSSRNPQMRKRKRPAGTDNSTNEAVVRDAAAAAAAASTTTSKVVDIHTDADMVELKPRAAASTTPIETTSPSHSPRARIARGAGAVVGAAATETRPNEGNGDDNEIGGDEIHREKDPRPKPSEEEYDDEQLQSPPHASSPISSNTNGSCNANSTTESAAATTNNIKEDKYHHGGTVDTTPCSQAGTSCSPHDDDDESSEDGGFNYGFNYTPPSQTQSQSQSQTQSSQRSSTYDDHAAAADDDEVEEQQQGEGESKSDSSSKTSAKKLLTTSSSTSSAQLEAITRNLLDDLVHPTQKPAAATNEEAPTISRSMTRPQTRGGGNKDLATDMALKSCQPCGADEGEIKEINKNEYEMFDDVATNPTYDLGLPSIQTKTDGSQNSSDNNSRRSLEGFDSKEEKKNDETAPSMAMAMFQTAGSKTTISVTEEGMNKANNLFSQSTSESTTIKAATSTYSMNKNINENQASSPAVVAVVTASVPTAAMFQTAGSKKTIFVTEKGMAKANDILSKAATDEFLSSNSSIGNSTKEDTSASATAMFQTAGLKKTISVSEKGKKRANDFFADTAAPAELRAQNPLQNKKVTPVEAAAMFQTAGLNKTISISEKGKKNANDLFVDHTKPQSLTPNLSSPTVAMFQTAGSKSSIQVTFDQMEKAESLLNKTSSSSSPSFEKPLSVVRSLGTVKGKSTHIDHATPSMNSIMKSNRPDNAYTSSIPAMPQSIGFTVAGSSQQIKVSEEGIRRATKFFEDSSSSPPDKSSKETFQTHTVMKKSVESASGGSASVAMPQSATNGSNYLAAMFQTADSKKAITVSEDSMARASKVLQSTRDIKQSSYAPSEEDVSKILPTKRFDNSVSASDGRASLAKASFHTAGRKSAISVSEESIDRATRLLNNGNENHISLAPPIREADSFKNMKHCSEFGVQNSSLGTVSSITTTKIEIPLPNAMFQTAGTKTTVTVTKESLARLGEMFDHPDADQNRSNVQGSNRNQADVVSSPLQRSPEQLTVGQKKTSLCAASHTKGGFVGFQIAGSGHEINVSEESMQQAAQLLEANAPLMPPGQGNEEHPNLSVLSRDDAGSTQGVTKDDGSNLVGNESSTQTTNAFSAPQAVFCVVGSSKTIQVHEESLDQARLLLDDTVERTDTYGSTLNENVQNVPSQLSTFQSTPSIKQTPITKIENTTKRNHAEPSETPMPSAARGLVRFGSVQRATYGLSPPPSRDVPECSDLTTDLEQPPMVHYENRNIEFTPKECGLPKRSAHITCSTGEGNALRKRDEGTKNPLTPVTINFTNPESDWNDSEQNTINNPHCQQSLTNRCTNLEDAIIEGEMTSSREISLEDGVNEIVLSVNSENAYQIRFDTSSQTPNGFANDSGTVNCLGDINDYRHELVKSGCDETKLKDSWITNHTRWIVWKLASYERKFSHFLAGKKLTYQNVVRQLQYRYKQEITEGLRSPLRKILNRDITASKMMVVMVCRTIHRPASVTEPAQGNSLRTLEVSDGWYSVIANLDKVLSEYVDKGLINPGTKLLVSNAKLIGEEEGIDPLDSGDGTSCDDCGASLTMYANSTRLAKWNTKLGFVTATNSDYSQGGFLVVKRVSDIVSRGGRVPVIRLFVRRVYQLMYLETVDTDQAGSDKTHTFLTQQEEDKRNMDFEKRWSQRAEKLSEALRAEIEKEVDEGAPELMKKKKINLDDDISHLPPEEQMEIERWRQQRADLVPRRLHEEVKSELEVETSLQRKSKPFLRVLVHTIDPKEGKAEHAILTVWSPTEDHRNVLKEGKLIQLFNLAVRGEMNGILNLSANEKTTIQSFQLEHLDFDERRPGFQPRHLLSLFEVHKLSRLAGLGGHPKCDKKDWKYFDVDVVGIQFYQQKVNESNQGYMTYVTDESGLVLRIQSKKALNTSATKEQNSQVREFAIVCLRDLRIHPYDSNQNCAVAEYGDLSSTFLAHKRIEELEIWMSSSLSTPGTLLSRLSCNTNAMLPFYSQRGERKTVLGYIVHIALSKRESMMSVTVDCNGFGSYTCELPHHLLDRMVQIVEEDGCLSRVTLCRSEEAIAPSLGRLAAIFRCRGFLWRFQICSKSAASRSSSSSKKYVIEEASRADKIAIAQAIDNWF